MARMGGKVSRKVTFVLTDEAYGVLSELAKEWGERSLVGALELLLRRAGGLAPFNQRWEDRAAVLRALVSDPPAAETTASAVQVVEAEGIPPERSEPFAAGPDVAAVAEDLLNIGPEAAETAVSANAVETTAEPDEAPDTEQPDEEPPAPTNMAGGRVFVRAWYDDGAPEWVQLLGADATSGLDLTPEQLAALNDWQAGIERDPP